MTAKKRPTTSAPTAKSATSTTVDADQETILRQALVVSAHAAINALRIMVGDTVVVNDYVEASSRHGGITTNSNGVPLPPGCNLRPMRNSLYGESVVFHGINANGNVVVSQSDTRGRVASGEHVELPYTFITVARSEQQRASLKLNDSYTGVVLNDGSSIAVGCQRFKTDKLRELLGLADKTATTIAARKAVAAPKLVANPAPTYVAPAPKAAVATKKAVVKKAAAKKVAKRVK